MQGAKPYLISKKHTTAAVSKPPRRWVITVLPKTMIYPPVNHPGRCFPVSVLERGRMRIDFEWVKRSLGEFVFDHLWISGCRKKIFRLYKEGTVTKAEISTTDIMGRRPDGIPAMHCLACGKLDDRCDTSHRGLYDSDNRFVCYECSRLAWSIDGAIAACKGGPIWCWECKRTISAPLEISGGTNFTERDGHRKFHCPVCARWEETYD